MADHLQCLVDRQPNVLHEYLSNHLVEVTRAHTDETWLALLDPLVGHGATATDVPSAAVAHP
ncbi:MULTISPECIES: hypothetical protein [Protofrankia]|uniref:Uncharacterized protein n=1 Tax=Protofrankia coriariae TaxID=1562887 RepID=A0ABR5F450_9ACTN|nr:MULTISPECIES: hypothetical protein [Protofrankia]KLL11500.1 hypothetical protein FrCorBMG51_10515 [Protofrankia coriariae]ONH34535.1 hypothetical protein BL254_15960 [Protofrankia sp. BMG5.30]